MAVVDSTGPSSPPEYAGKRPENTRTTRGGAHTGRPCPTCDGVGVATVAAGVREAGWKREPGRRPGGPVDGWLGWSDLSKHVRSAARFDDAAGGSLQPRTSHSLYFSSIFLEDFFSTLKHTSFCKYKIFKDTGLQIWLRYRFRLAIVGIT